MAAAQKSSCVSFAIFPALRLCRRDSTAMDLRTLLQEGKFSGTEQRGIFHLVEILNKYKQQYCAGCLLSLVKTYAVGGVCTLF